MWDGCRSPKYVCARCARWNYETNRTDGYRRQGHRNGTDDEPIAALQMF